MAIPSALLVGARMWTVMLAALPAAAAVLPAPLSARSFDPRPIVSGGSAANLVFGKLQRAAQLPGARLLQPLAAVDDVGSLDRLLWSSFMMASCPKQDIVSRADISPSSAVLSNALLFVDGLSPEPKGLFGGFSLPFGKKKPQGAPGYDARPFDAALLEAAAARGARHAYLLLPEGAASPRPARLAPSRRLTSPAQRASPTRSPR